MSRAFDLRPEVIAAQRRAADPQSSVWVSAHAGSGKTHVLTERVLRLLLSGAPPEQILCLTYTKAAAAEMRKRVSARLGAWALLDDAALAEAVAATDGAMPDAARLIRARTLFAHALETPGGLKIMTIHAFCESVLHRFPREAGVPFDFTVLDDNERDRIVLGAREAVLAGGLRGEGAAAAVATLFGLMSDSQIADAIDAALAEQPRLRQVLAGLPQARRALRKLLGFGGGAPREGVLSEIAAGYPFDAADHRALFARVAPVPGGRRFVDCLGAIDPARPDPLGLLEAFLTKEERTARARLLNKADAEALPDLAARLADEALRLEGLAKRLVAAELVERSEALLDVLAAISARYEAEKRSRSLLDFDDLIEALRRLLADRSIGPWVRYKLDSGITHVLVDESQDTNSEQWLVVRALTDDFFDGETAAQRLRTIFAVGDKKQSIYSFQGADPTLFVDKGAEYGLLVRTARLSFDTVPLKTSFRTLPRILEAVDLTFARDDLRRGILSEDGYEPHDSARRHKGGVVTLWPPIAEAGDETDPDSWPTEVPPHAVQSAARQVAERLARDIHRWVAERRPLAARGRAVVPGDVLILVQTRGALFREIIRALIRAGLPTPGADRLAVTSHIGVLDLMALGDVLLNPADDLQLAALLRSPLFDIGEADLFAIAQPRGRDETLWAALAASPLPAARDAYGRLKGWRDRADFDRPFEFFAGVLYAGDGLRRFHARLGAEIDDVFAAFLELALANEQGPQPSLLGFLAALRESAVSIKRELAESGEGVRVMTVHGAKGLEAPIVILADAATTSAGKTGKPVYMRGGPNPLFVHAGALKAHTAETRQIREDDEANLRDEYWRKLYVAMTRAEDELYVTGALTRTGTLAGSWYEAIAEALGPEAEAHDDGTLIYPKDRPAPLPADATAEVTPSAAPLVLSALPPCRLSRIIRPSQADREADVARVLETGAEQLADRRDPESARREGSALHALLHHLSRLEPAVWDAVAARALPALLPDLPMAHAALAAKARAILTRPELAPLFAANSRGEVPILAQGTRNGAPVTLAGRIDRLVVAPDRVLIVDYKSDARPPATAETVPAAYLTQLGLYALVATQLFPGRPVQAAILWTELESLMNLPADSLRPRVASFTIG